MWYIANRGMIFPIIGQGDMKDNYLLFRKAKLSPDPLQPFVPVFVNPKL